jgi:uncharacterized surface protein with fasciclin (FAS1) repeats
MAAFTSCDDDMSDDSHYKRPSFMTGNAYETLEAEGNYSIFLRGVDLIGYQKTMRSQLLTVLAPSDEAFQTFLAAKGYSSIDDLYAADPTYVRKLITYHMLYYAYDWSKMVNFRPEEGDGATEAEKAESAGLYSHFRTRCSDDETTETYWDASTQDSVTVTVYHLERNMPVFSSKMFETLGIDAQTNYEYFFPSSTWTGGTYASTLEGGFNVANASVLDADNVITDNGYLYHINQVIEPLNTINEELRTRSNYSTFYKLYDSYSEYELDETETTNRGYDVYLHKHTTVPNIALEWPTSSYLNFATNTQSTYTIFVPTDNAIAKLFSEFWEEGSGYSKVDDLDPMILEIFLESTFANTVDYTAFPELINKGEINSGLGAAVSFNTADVTDRIMCCNGAIYGMDNMDVPDLFGSAVAPAFKDVKYLPYLYALKRGSMLNSFLTKEAQFITLIPDTAQFSYEQMRLLSAGTNSQLQAWDDEAAAYSQVSSSVCQNMVNIHTATIDGENEGLKTEGIQVIETNASYNYWYVVDGKITTNALFNEQLNPDYTEDPFVGFREISNHGSAWNNGRSYVYDYPGIFMPAESGQSLERQLTTCNDRNYPYYCFAQLLRAAELADMTTATFIGGLTLDTESPRFFTFVPTNEALKEAIQTLPGCSKCSFDDNFKLSGKPTVADLAKYLLSYFVPSYRNAFSSYPYPGSSTKGDFETDGTYGMHVTDLGSSITVSTIDDKGAYGDAVAVKGDYHYLPFAFTDGAFQLLDGVLK